MKSLSPAIFFQRLQWSVNRKVTLCFGLLVLLIIVSSTTVFFSILNLENSDKKASQKNISQEDAHILQQQLVNLNTAYNDAIFLSDQSQVNHVYTLSLQNTITNLKLDEPEMLTDPKSALNQMITAYTNLSQLNQQFDQLLLTHQLDQAAELSSNNQPVFNAADDASKLLFTQLQAQNKEFNLQSSQAAGFTKTVAILAGILAVLFAVFLAWLLSATIGEPLKQIRFYLEKVSKGDLSGNLKLVNRDEVGDLVQALNQSVGSLSSIVASVNIGSQIEEVVTDLNQVSAKQSDYANEQVSYVSQVSASIQQLDQTARLINQSAIEVAQASQTTLTYTQSVTTITADVNQAVIQLKTVVGETGQELGKAKEDFTYVINQLSEVSTQSQAIEVIVKIMSDLAHQTHLLALNAGIEAAGAGIYGERFSVIAQEIKQLADNSANASNEIKDLIANTRQALYTTREQAEARQQSVGNAVEMGMQVEALVERVFQRVADNQKAVETILQAAINSNTQATQIKSATFEQQAASQQVLSTMRSIMESVNLGVAGSDKVTQTSSQLSHISHSLSERLSELRLSVPVSVL